MVYLKIDNIGDMPFNYKVAVTVKGSTMGKNAWGEDIYLPNYLRYGVVFGTTEADVEAQVADRLTARTHATTDWGMLDTWAEPSPYTMKPTDASHYAALIIHMPEEVGDIANYRGTNQPRVDLGIKVFAQQSGTDMYD